MQSHQRPIKRVTKHVKSAVRDDEGMVVITQKPNAPLLVALVTTVLSAFWLVNRPLGILFGLIAYGCWFTWAWMEIFEGANLWRRILGSGALALLILTGWAIILWSFPR